MDQEAKKIVGNAFISMNLIGQSPCFQTAIRNIRMISEFDVGVHISGETGTGKELAARAIHYLSARCDRPFIPISCGGLSDELILNELFGHVKGAYTSADSKQPGVIQVARGTLPSFLGAFKFLLAIYDGYSLYSLQQMDHCPTVFNGLACRSDESSFFCADLTSLSLPHLNRFLSGIVVMLFALIFTLQLRCVQHPP